MRGESALSADERALWQARAVACELLAFSLRYPSEETSSAVASGEWAGAAREVRDALGLDVPDADLDVSGAPDLHGLRVEATRLFVGSPLPACNPYEGFWRAKDDGVQPLMFVNPHTQEVEGFCRSCGLVQASGGANEPLDHIATELELMQYLASVESGIVRPFAGSPEASALPGGSAGAAYEQFRSCHLLSFAPRFAVLLEESARVGFYRATARLLAAFLG